MAFLWLAVIVISVTGHGLAAPTPTVVSIDQTNNANYSEEEIYKILYDYFLTPLFNESLPFASDRDVADFFANFLKKQFEVVRFEMDPTPDDIKIVDKLQNLLDEAKKRFDDNQNLTQFEERFIQIGNQLMDLLEKYTAEQPKEGNKNLGLAYRANPITDIWDSVSKIFTIGSSDDKSKEKEKKTNRDTEKRLTVNQLVALLHVIRAVQQQNQIHQGISPGAIAGLPTDFQKGNRQMEDVLKALGSMQSGKKTPATFPGIGSSPPVPPAQQSRQTLEGIMSVIKSMSTLKPNSGGSSNPLASLVSGTNSMGMMIKLMEEANRLQKMQAIRNKVSQPNGNKPIKKHDHTDKENVRAELSDNLDKLRQVINIIKKQQTEQQRKNEEMIANLLAKYQQQQEQLNALMKFASDQKMLETDTTKQQLINQLKTNDKKLQEQISILRRFVENQQQQHKETLNKQMSQQEQLNALLKLAVRKKSDDVTGKRVLEKETQLQKQIDNLFKFIEQQRQQQQSTINKQKLQQEQLDALMKFVTAFNKRQSLKSGLESIRKTTESPYDRWEKRKPTPTPKIYEEEEEEEEEDEEEEEEMNSRKVNKFKQTQQQLKQNIDEFKKLSDIMKSMGIAHAATL